MRNGRRMRIHRMSKRRMRFLGIALIVAACCLIVGLYVLFRHIEESRYQETRGVMSEGFGAIPTVERDGVIYQQRLDQTRILLMGVDQTSDTPSSGYRNGGQADFLLLLTLDHTDKTIHQLQIERDTIAQVVMLGVLGNEVGTRQVQICLAHGFGKTPQDNCSYQVKAVENLLQGTSIGLYMAMNMEGIGVLNDVLGGVTVTIEDDFTAHDPMMSSGRTITLDAQQAVLFVRSRMDVGDGTNKSRMQRHRAFMSAVTDRLSEMLDQDVNALGAVYDQIQAVATTNISRGRLINEANRAYHYDILPVETLMGEYKIGEDGFVEFHVDEQALLDYVMQVFYRPVSR